MLEIVLRGNVAVSIYKINEAGVGKGGGVSVMSLLSSLLKSCTEEKYKRYEIELISTIRQPVIRFLIDLKSVNN